MPDGLETPRLVLRRWTAEDLEPFAAMNADPAVMVHFVSPLSRTQSDLVAGRILDHFARHGFGLWAVEVRSVTPFAGFLGLSIPSFEAHFTPCVEIGWRLAAKYWDQGYATEGATAVMACAFDTLSLDEIVSFTTPANWRSRRLMARLGMQHRSSDDFEHPGLPPGHPLRPHVLYRSRRSGFRLAPDSHGGSKAQSQRPVLPIRGSL